VGDDQVIKKKLIGRVKSDPKMSIQRRLALDAKLRHAALRKGFDSIVLLTPKSLETLRRNGTIPRTIELNVVNLGRLRHSAKGGSSSRRSK
jgi:hypothetical protein